MVPASDDSLLIHGARVITPAEVVEDGWVLVTAGKIAALGRGPERPAAAATLDAAGQYLAPGFIDLHVHGGDGADFSDGTPEAFAIATRFYARRGVTALQATTISLPFGELRRALDVARAWLAEPHPGCAAVVGVHFEGPYLSVGRRGCHPAEYLRPPGPAETDFLLSYADVITEVTVAPELPGALEMIRRLADAGIVVSLGHSEATEPVIREAIAAGARHSTHLYNAMSTATKQGPYRIPGLLETVLAEDALTSEVIADGRHVLPTLLRLAYRCKGPERLCLVSDAMRGAGLPEGGRLTIAGEEAVVRDGVAMRPDFSSLASSITPVDQMVRNVVEMIGVPLPRAIEMATRTPARVLGIADRKGSIAVGLDADLVLLDAALQVRRTVVGGQTAYSGE